MEMTEVDVIDIVEEGMSKSLYTIILLGRANRSVFYRLSYMWIPKKFKV